VITDWANTRCKKTCITKAGFGNTACTIWASWPTVARISMSSSVRLDSLFGGVVLGSARERHLLANEYATTAKSSQNRQNGIIAFHVLLDTIDEKVMLIHVYLHTGGTTIEVK
jgi:hypothetical protein